MTPARFIPACQVQGTARPRWLGGGRGVGGYMTVNEKINTGGWGGQPPPIPSGLRSVLAPHDPPVLYLHFVQMIIGQASTYRPHPVTVGYIFQEAGLELGLFIESGGTKVLCLIRTITLFQYPLDSLIIT